MAAESGDYVGVTGAHKTLPLPSYVEVTSLASGRTILLRLERRGPMTNDRLIGLSAAAMQQLGVGEGAAVRMRRVNPPEDDRAMLRLGGEAPLRMETPQGLLEVLRKRLPAAGSASLADPRQAQVSGNVPTPAALAAIDPDEPAKPREMATQVPAQTPQPVATPETAPAPTKPSVQPARTPVPATTEARGRFVVQLGAFSVRANAAALARKVGGRVSPSGKLSLVQVGPFSSRGQAADALAKLRGQGYSQGLIKTLD